LLRVVAREVEAAPETTMVVPVVPVAFVIK
jgi:hypothetical protein